MQEAAEEARALPLAEQVLQVLQVLQAEQAAVGEGVECLGRLALLSR